MSNCNKCNPCGGCNPARYDCNFDISVSPYDPSTWLVTTCGMMHKVKVPKINETDTKLATNYSNSTLVYSAEKHTDIITGNQLGDIINLDYLRNVDIDNGLNGNCYELVYRKYANCGEGCKSASDKWANFNINSDGALQCGIKYVRGANAYGCPVYLDVPSDKNQYWFAMWKPSGDCNEFTYVKPREVAKLPTDSQGNTRVLSVTSNGEPVLGPILAGFCSKAVEFTCRKGDPVHGYYFTPNATTVQEFNVTPDDDTGWRAPCCGVMMVSYCINPIEQAAGKGEVDVTAMLDNETWNSDLESRSSSHSTWTWTQSGTDVSESATRFMIVSKGRTMKLHARNTGDVSGQGMNVRAGRWRVHSVRALFIPLEVGE